jgi:hypothetical protein
VLVVDRAIVLHGADNDSFSSAAIHRLNHFSFVWLQPAVSPFADIGWAALHDP